jgi:hypothetical protein
MADTNLYATLHYVDPKRIKCASNKCDKQVGVDHKIETVIGTIDCPSTHHVELYFCHECYQRVRLLLDGNLYPWAIAKAPMLRECPGFDLRLPEEVQ